MKNGPDNFTKLTKEDIEDLIVQQSMNDSGFPKFMKVLFAALALYTGIEHKDYISQEINLRKAEKKIEKKKNDSIQCRKDSIRRRNDSISHANRVRDNTERFLKEEEEQYKNLYFEPIKDHLNRWAGKKFPKGISLSADFYHKNSGNKESVEENLEFNNYNRYRYAVEQFFKIRKLFEIDYEKEHIESLVAVNNGSLKQDVALYYLELTFRGLDRHLSDSIDEEFTKRSKVSKNTDIAIHQLLERFRQYYTEATNVIEFYEGVWYEENIYNEIHKQDPFYWSNYKNTWRHNNIDGKLSYLRVELYRELLMYRFQVLATIASSIGEIELDKKFEEHEIKKVITQIQQAEKQASIHMKKMTQKYYLEVKKLENLLPAYEKKQKTQIDQAVKKFCKEHPDYLKNAKQEKIEEEEAEQE